MSTPTNSVPETQNLNYVVIKVPDFMMTMLRKYTELLDEAEGNEPGHGTSIETAILTASLCHISTKLTKAAIEKGWRTGHDNPNQCLS